MKAAGGIGCDAPRLSTAGLSARLAYTMRASNGAQSVADPALRRCLPPLPAMEPWASVARPEALARDSGAAGGGSRRAAAQRVSQARRYDPPAPAACVP
jgi:hypothetical protein